LDPSAIDNLLLNLKLQLLALPALARWGVILFAGIVVLREGITMVWKARQLRGGQPRSAPATLAGSGSSTAPDPRPMALPAPDPFAQPAEPAPEVIPEKRTSPPPHR
jgi:hypothetical protein